MSRKRYVSTNISTDQKVLELDDRAGPYAVILYTWMIPHALDDGTLTGHERELKMLVVPGLPMTPDDVAVAVAHMIDLGMLERLDDGRLRFPLRTFYAYQTYVKPDRRGQESTETPSSDPVHPGNSQNVGESPGFVNAPVSPSVSPPVTSLPALSAPEARATDATSPRAGVKATGRATNVDDAYRAQLIAEFGEDLGGADAVRDSIEAALSHKARRKYTDERIYVRNWLRNDARASPASTTSSAMRGNGRAGARRSGRSDDRMAVGHL